MIVTVAADSTVPPYEQIRTQILDAVQSGALAPGARLPPVRRLATDLGLAVNTVARAYRELESQGVVETRGRNGTVVSPHGDPATRAAQQAAMTYAQTVRRLGLTTAEARAFIDAALET
jgi:DNA-binding transcriptional regulator YhcF (GntR family)